MRKLYRVVLWFRSTILLKDIVSQMSANLYSNDSLCFISDKLRDISKDSVRNRVCAYLPTTEFQNNYYCVLHLPVKEKKEQFFIEFWNKCKRKDYHFDWVWFPQFILDPIAFEGEASFRNAFFSDYTVFGSSIFDSHVSFDNAIFTSRADFSGVRFDKRAIFTGCKFDGDFTSFDNAYFNAFEGDILTIHFNDIRSKGVFHFQAKEINGNATFANATFEKKANFDNTEFKQQASFSDSTFIREASFDNVKFCSIADFKWSTFSHNTYFDRVEFCQFANFNSSSFTLDSDILFRNSTFKNIVDFSYATFSGFVTFENQRLEPMFSETHLLSFRYARLEAPDKLSFIKVLLFPNWFIGVDSRKINFIDVTWKNISNYFPNLDVQAELKKRSISNKIPLFGITCRQLAENAETHNRFEEAMNFRRMSMQLENLKIARWRRPFTMHWWYGFLSLYGENWKRALLILLGILIFFTVYYRFAFFTICPKNQHESSACVTRTMNTEEAIHHSIMTAALQNVEYRKSVTDGEDFMMLSEKITVPLQLALFALAIRRKFMR